MDRPGASLAAALTALLTSCSEAGIETSCEACAGGAGGGSSLPAVTGPTVAASSGAGPAGECGNGLLEQGEICDDGNHDDHDDCSNACTPAPPRPPPCEPKITGAVTTMAAPSKSGAGVPPIWSYEGDLGVKAGDNLCAAIGAHRVCEWGEVKKAVAEGELVSAWLPPEVKSFWAHRVAEVEIVNGVPSAPGSGGRCLEWTGAHDLIADAEYCHVGSPDPQHPEANAAVPPGYAVYGELYCYFDQNTCYTGDQSDGCQGHGPYDGGSCCIGARAILCCSCK
jgi:cysteine-rich repeat protein